MNNDSLRPSISVVVPALNMESTIGVQLDALRRQAFSAPWELIVVDNGSTDATAELTAASPMHPTCEVRVIREPRRGLNRARNAGIRAATAERVAICDADDEVDERWLEKLCAALESCDIVAGGLEYGRLNGASTCELLGWKDRAGKPQRSLNRALGFLDQVIGANIAMKRDVWSQLDGFDESFVNGGDDVDFAWRAQIAGYQIADATDAFVHYRGRTSKRALFRQYVREGSGSAHLYRAFGARGMPRRSVGKALRSVTRLCLDILSLPFSEPGRQGHIIRAAGKQYGRLRGSLTHRVIYL